MDSINNSIDYIEFSATDLEAVKKFYSLVFAWKFTDWGPDYVSFESGKIGGGFTRQALKTGNSPLVILYSNALEKTCQSVKQNGGSITKEIFMFPGGRRFHFEGPDGNEMAVWSDK